jgi:hypothetical protein
MKEDALMKYIVKESSLKTQEIMIEKEGEEITMASFSPKNSNSQPDNKESSYTPEETSSFSN